MGFNKIIRQTPWADKSAVGAMNRPLRRLRRRTWDTAFNLLRHGSVVKKSPYQLEQSHRVTLSEAKGLSRSAERSFASLRMTGLTLSVGEELSRSFEPCLISIIWSLRPTPDSPGRM